MENVKCPICSCYFLPKTAKQTKCATCENIYPDASSLEELKNRDRANTDVPKKFSEDQLKSMVLSILDELGLNLKVCDKCGKPFIPRSPAQKSCPACRDKSNETKETKNDVKGTDNG